jgi:hypothetical protein
VSIDLRTLSVTQVIVHQVPKRDRSIEADDAITFSDAPIPDLGSTDRNFFVERINASLIERAFSIVPLAGRVSTMPELVHELLGDAGRLVEISKDMARNLYNAQRKVSNPGLLTVLVGQSADGPCVAILKLQYREGMRIQPMRTADGQQTFSARIFDDLTLTEDARVFKASLFRATGLEVDKLEGLASDDQRKASSGSDLADFFLTTFLGCTFATAPDRQTRDFYDAASAFITTISDPELRIDYRRALVTALSSPAKSLSAPEFADQFLHDEHKTSYDRVFEERGVPTTAFDKDLRLVKNDIKRTRIETRGGLTISGSPDAIAERVTFVAAEGDEPAQIVVVDDVSKVG